MYSWKLNSPLTNRPRNKGHEGLEGMRENKQTESNSNTKLQTPPKNKKTTSLELIKMCSFAASTSLSF